MDESLNGDKGLLELAEHAGLMPVWKDAWGRSRHVSPDVLRKLLSALELPADSASQVRDSLQRLKPARHITGETLVIGTVNKAVALPDSYQPATPAYKLLLESGQSVEGKLQKSESGSMQLPPVAQIGYHQLFLGNAQITLAIAPVRCPSVAGVTGSPDARLWGIGAQLYSLRHSHQSGTDAATGFGDFSALATLARGAARQGASVVAISPIHAMFNAEPEHYSPYAPSSRLFLNAMYACPEICLGEQAVVRAQDALHLTDDLIRMEARSTIDWPGAARNRMHLFRRLFHDFAAHRSEQQRNAFIAFRHAGGEPLESHARFESLHAHYQPLLDKENNWQHWPADLRNPASDGVQAFAERHADEIAFHVFLQWLASQGLHHAQQCARNAGMSVGLISDLAVGTDPRGSHAWSRQDEILTGVTVGAAPDIYNPFGQNWGLTAFSPRALQENSYGAFIEMLRANLAHTGGIRIDHALGLHRMWLVPYGASPADGVYLQYPQEDLLRLIALEAWRHQAIVIGENLGTVPAGFNQTLEQAGVLGIGVLWFQRDGAQAALPDQPFLPPEQWSPHEIATTATHDLPTVCGWWKGRDLDWRSRLNLIPPEDSETSLRQQRERDKNLLWQALCDAKSVLSIDPEPPSQPPLEAVLNFVARGPAPLMLAPLEDLLGLAEQPNLPGTIDGHPNWLQRLPVGVGRLFDDDQVQRCVTAITQGREAS